MLRKYEEKIGKSVSKEMMQSLFDISWNNKMRNSIRNFEGTADET